MVPRILFFQIQSPARLSAWAADHLVGDLFAKHDEFLELLDLGAIYVNQKREVDAEHLLIPGDLVRLHHQPRRFPKSLWADRVQVIFEDSDFQIVDKPTGVPVHPGLDNRLENLWTHLRGHEPALRPTHRLDIGTRGLVVFAKNADAQSEFCRMLEGHKVNKTYTALTRTGPPLPRGELTHWMRAGDRAPRQISRNCEAPSDRQCRLEILEDDGRLVRLRLLTGRTHQIRAQLGYECRAIEGDAMYGDSSTGRQDHWQLRAHRIEFPWKSGRIEAAIKPLSAAERN